MKKKMPEVQPPALMEAALDVMFYVHSRGGRWFGTSAFYLSPHRDTQYTQRTGVKTKQEAVDRQRRDTIQFLKDLRAQIDEVLPKLESRPLDTEGFVWAESSAYQPRTRYKDTDETPTEGQQ
jgi:hypothetical protein